MENKAKEEAKAEGQGSREPKKSSRQRSARETRRNIDGYCNA